MRTSNSLLVAGVGVSVVVVGVIVNMEPTPSLGRLRSVAFFFVCTERKMDDWWYQLLWIVLCDKFKWKCKDKFLHFEETVENLQDKSDCQQCARLRLKHLGLHKKSNQFDRGWVAINSIFLYPLQQKER